MRFFGAKTTEPVRRDVIRLDTDRRAKRSAATDYGFLLVVFMRVVAGLWIVRGLMHWRTILTPDATPFEALPLSLAACVVFFAVVDLLAAVGLWLASGWGGVLWLFAVSASIIVTAVIPDFHSGARAMLAIDFALIAVYFVLTWHAARMRED